MKISSGAAFAFLTLQNFPIESLTPSVISFELYIMNHVWEKAIRKGGGVRTIFKARTYASYIKKEINQLKREVNEMTFFYID